MNLFGKLPQERAIATLIHDHCNATSLLGSGLKIIERELKEGNVEEALIWLVRNKEHVKRAQEVLDTYLVKCKNDFNE